MGRPLAIALVGLSFIVLGILAWTFFGRAPQTVSGFGYVVPAGGYTEIGTQVNGLVASVEVEPGQGVREGEELVRVDTEISGGASESILSPVDGTVIEVVALPGRITEPGDPMLYLQPLGSPPSSCTSWPSGDVDFDLFRGTVPGTSLPSPRGNAAVSPAKSRNRACGSHSPLR